VEVEKILRKYEAQFQEELRKLRLRKNDGFLIRHFFEFTPSTTSENALLASRTKIMFTIDLVLL